MSRKDARRSAWLLGIIATTYFAWKINRNRECIERCLLSQQKRNVKAMIILYGNGMPIKTVEETKGPRRPKGQVRNRKGSSRKGHRPTQYRREQGANRRKESEGSLNLPRIRCMAAVAMSASNRRQAQVSKFDTDAKLIRVDNCASYCISNDAEDFITELRPVRRKLKGLGGTIADVQTGTIRWRIQDDGGIVHNIEIPNSLYVKESPSKLLSPQHWAQTVKDHQPRQHGTWCATYDDKVVLH